MELTGTLINYYFHCKRQCYFAGNRMNFEHNSQLVQIGTAMHQAKNHGAHTEVYLEGICIDKIQGDYVIEYKKSNADMEAAKWQLYYYLHVLKRKGIDKKGKIICFENATGREKVIELELTTAVEMELEQLKERIFELIQQEVPSAYEKMPKCEQCAYRYYCFV